MKRLFKKLPSSWATTAGLRYAALGMGLAVLFLIAWSLPASQSIAQASRVCQVLDSSGRQVRINLPVRRIVVLNSDALEAVRILGAQDLVVGVNELIPKAPRFWDKLAKLPTVGAWREPNYEAIAALHPDLVLAYGYTPGPALNQKLGAMGITVLRLDLYKLATMEKDMALLGEVLGRQDRARDFIAWYQQCRGALEKFIAQSPDKPRAYVEGYASMQAVGPGSSGYAMSLAAGCRPIAAALSIPFPLVSNEWVLREDPQVIVKVSNLNDSYDDPDPAELRGVWRKVQDRPGWRNIAAVQQGRVHALAQDLWVGPAMVIGLAYLTKWFHPQACRDFQPRQWHRHYLSHFQALPLRGCFVYPD